MHDIVRVKHQMATSRFILVRVASPSPHSHLEVTKLMMTKMMLLHLAVTSFSITTLLSSLSLDSSMSLTFSSRLRKSWNKTDFRCQVFARPPVSCWYWRPFLRVGWLPRGRRGLSRGGGCWTWRGRERPFLQSPPWIFIWHVHYSYQGDDDIEDI